MDFSRYSVPGSDETFYIPDFITKDEEEYLIRKIGETPQPKWKQLAKRRRVPSRGDLTPNSILIPQAMPSFLSEYPDLIARLKATGAFGGSPHQQPNHVILNQYLPGQGIMPHEDGPAYYPVVATLSLGSHTVMHYYQYSSSPSGSDTGETDGKGRAIDPTPILSLLLEPRSLVITTSALYTRHLHGIDALEDDDFGRGAGVANVELLTGAGRDVVEGARTLPRRVRYSLTCRDVTRVANVVAGRTFGKR
ncbi:hypothetical protein FA95DRAFT_1584663 [Auriscalpium vulgare]|uniref:Uncharacterized protein n=1 Tax=Auriscalpium vulgare TaxID=40419 RepID=A0ACB8RDB6_9AGAM|nr:hypothetical protein FA95DRAFT_1584663 [Auriscalpium vulgare]